MTGILKSQIDWIPLSVGAVAKAFLELDEAGRMKPPRNSKRVNQRAL